MRYTGRNACHEAMYGSGQGKPEENCEDGGMSIVFSEVGREMARYGVIKRINATESQFGCWMDGFLTGSDTQADHFQSLT